MSLRKEFVEKENHGGKAEKADSLPADIADFRR
jgi:hypothetical protein